MDRETFGRFIADTRRNAGMTQQDLADRLHVTNTAVSKWERGLCYPDVTLLENLALTLGLTLAELMACEKTTNETTADIHVQDNITSLMNIANESHRRQRSKMLWSILLVAVATALLAALAYYCVISTRTNWGVAKYIGSQTKEEGNFIYMERGDDLLCLRCEDQQMFDTIVSGFAEQYYTIEYRYNTITRQGTLEHCEINDLILGTPMNMVGASIGADSLLGVDCVWEKYIDIYPDPDREGHYLYTLQYYYTGNGNQYFQDNQPETYMFTVKNCRATAAFDYDADGVNELFVLTKYNNAPYMLYDTVDGIISARFVDDVPSEVQEQLHIGYEE